MSTLTGESEMVMPVQPMGGGYGGFGGYPVAVPYAANSCNNGGGGLFGGNNGDSWLGILFLIALLGGGFGFGGFGGGMMGMGMADGMMLYPWLNNSQNINDGFRDQMINSTLTGIQGSVTSGFGDVQLGIAGINNAICQTGSGINQNISNGFAQAEIAANARQMADMQQNYTNQLANVQAMNGIQNSITDCCCKEQAGIENLRYTVATEACADRAAVSDALQQITVQGSANTNAIINTITGGIQSLKDQLCQDKIDEKNDRIQQLQTQLNMATLSASNVAQTAQLIQDNNAQTAALINRIAPYPTASYIVPNPYAYNFGGSGCGCNTGCNTGCGF